MTINNGPGTISTAEANIESTPGDVSAELIKDVRDGVMWVCVSASAHPGNSSHIQLDISMFDIDDVRALRDSLDEAIEAMDAAPRDKDGFCRSGEVD